MKSLLLSGIFLFSMTVFAQEDPYLWLEEVDGEKALAFVTEENQKTVDKLTSTPYYQNIYDQALAIYNSTDRIAYPTTYGDYVYNFWKDKDHVRGIWRRTTQADYTSGNPKWETVLDIDALSAADDKKWVFKGASGLYPDYNRFLIRLSNGGGDAVEIKEFDAISKQFISDGFYIPEAKGSADYVDENTILVGSDFGDNTMTTSGYPNQVKIWKRGTALADAQLIHEGNTTDVGSWPGVLRDGDKKYITVYQAVTFFTRSMKVWHNDQLISLDIPEDAAPSGVLNNQMIMSLKSDWTVNDTTYKQGAIVSLSMTDLLEGKHTINLVYQPDEFSSVSGMSTTKNTLIINVLNHVISKLFIYTFDGKHWHSKPVNAPDFGALSVVNTNELTDDYYFQFENFLTPETLYSANAQDNTYKAFKSLPAFFDGSKFEVNQHKAKSPDGTLIPYFIVSPKNMKTDGSHPTLLYAYGGFESSSTPFYSGGFGTGWLENGGVFVLANIRGGGEYGPKWHQAGLKEKRQNVYDDFHAVAEDLIARKITSPEHLGIMGGSNGGLLVGVAFTQRPDLYNAVVCQVPLLDMKRYNKLLAGASWMGEYGNPDIPEEWGFIKKYSPYHNLKSNTEYPEVFFYTSTRDDRVHPGHARKMAAKMMDMGYPIYYYENTEGGHAGSSTNEQRAKSTALSFSYLLKKLK